MSLIHDALKKAEQEKQPTPVQNPLLTRPILPPSKKIPPRTLFLIGILAVSFGLLIYFRFLRPSQPTSAVPTPKQTLDTFTAEKNPQALKKTALQLFQEKKWEAALAAWEKLTLLLPTDAEIHNNMGLTYKKLRKKEDAFQAYTRALALKEDYPEAHNNLGVLYLEDGQRAEAKKKFQRALELNPLYPDPHFHLGLVLEQEGNGKTAAGHYEKYLQMAPDLPAGLKEKLETKIGRLNR